jgi:hypothetical protein
MNRTTDTSERKTGGRLPARTRDLCRDEPSRSSHAPATRCGPLSTGVSAAGCSAIEPQRRVRTSDCGEVLRAKKSMHRGARGSITVQTAAGPTAASDTIRLYVGLLREIAREHGIETPPPPSAGGRYEGGENGQ